MDRAEQIVLGALGALNRTPTASLAQIAEAIGVSRATLHRHFATREDLLHAIGTRAVQRWQDGLDRVDGVDGVDGADRVDDAASADPETLGTMLRGLLRTYTTDAIEYGFALTDQFINNAPDLFAWGERLQRREIAFLTVCQRAGVLRADLPVEWIDNTIYGLMIAAAESVRLGNVAPRALPDLVIDTFFKGAGA